MTKEILFKVLEIVDQNGDNDAPLTANDTFKSIGLDSLDVMDVLLDLETAFPGIDLENYEPTEGTTMQQIAEEIERRLAQ